MARVACTPRKRDDGSDAHRRAGAHLQTLYSDAHSYRNTRYTFSDEDGHAATCHGNQNTYSNKNSYAFQNTDIDPHSDQDSYPDQNQNATANPNTFIDSNSIEKQPPLSTRQGRLFDLR